MRFKEPILPHVVSQTTSCQLIAMKPISITWVLAAHAPEPLARFYALAFGTVAEQGFSRQHWRVPLADGGCLEIYRPSRSRPFPERGRTLAPCLRLSACEHPLELLEACLPELIASGARVQQPPRVEPFGAEAWLEDPEQNPLLVVAPSI
tara:strand:- start:298 stop:747 length:450 start_codon:yes stop_codon:yes gene_type:complete